MPMPVNNLWLPARIGAALLIAYAVARTQSALPDLTVYNVSDLPPQPNGAITVTVSNSGSATTVTDVAFYRGSVFRGSAVEFYRQSITLMAGNVMNASAPPRPLLEGEIYSVCVDPNKSIPERNENNNCKTFSVSSAAGDLSVTTADISIAPVGANPGEPMRVSAIVRNRRAVAATALVRLHQGHPESPNTKVLGQADVHVPANGSAAAAWTVPRPEGDSNLFVSVDDVMPREYVRSDNISSRNIFLKSIINTGRVWAGGYASNSPAVADLAGTGQPVMVFGEHTGTFDAAEGRVTAIQVFNDGTTKELWSRVLAPAPSHVLSPSIADLDGDGSPEIIVAMGRTLTPASGEGYVFALDRAGNTKWSQKWDAVGRVSCLRMQYQFTPLLGDMNKDGVADVVVFDNEIIVLDGRNGAVLRRNSNLPRFGAGWCEIQGSYGAIADLDGDGSNEIIVGNYGIHVFNSDLTRRWTVENNNRYWFALVDVEKDGKPEIVVPLHRQRFEIIDGQTGALKKWTIPQGWSPFSQTIAATTSLDPAGLPTFAIANNDYANGAGALDSQINVKWWAPHPIAASVVDNPRPLVLADLMGLGRPQIISRSDRRSIAVQDIKDGRYLADLGVFGFGFHYSAPVPVDVDGDGRGEVIVSYGVGGGLGKLDYEPQYPAANYLIFGSDHWKKIPSLWNHNQFIPGQVDKKLAFRHDYQPYKTHNTWFQQPLRRQCDVDFDDDVDQNDIAAIFAVRGLTVGEGDPRDYDRDKVITVADSRGCALKCTSPACAAANQPPRILSVGPRRAFPGSAISVTIRGEFVNFKPGQTTAAFGPGVSVGGAAPGAMGPVTVIDFETATANLVIQPGQTGDRTVTVSTGALTASREAAFSLSAGNLPPVARAGSDQQVLLGGSISLSGQVTDDGLPNANLSVTWQAIGGPGAVVFSNPNSTSTTAGFSEEGFYVLRLSATDGQYTGSDDLGVRVIAGNQAPYVSAGPDRSAPRDAPLRLSGEVLDDGLPPAAPVSIQWSTLSGPAAAAFNPANASVTTVIFPSSGVYVLRLTANDTQLSAADEVTVTVTPPLPEILTVMPQSAVPGQSRTVTIAAKNANFVSGSTLASFGAGISVGGAPAGTPGPVRVINPLTLEADLTVAASATLGARAVSVRTGVEQASKAEAFTIGAIGAPYSVRLNLTATVVAPGGSITSRPEALDAAGNVIGGAGQVFTMTVTPKPGQTTGNAPSVNGLTASFPKLVKRMINQNPAEDPAGEFADGDPTDPNYGKETGGLYTLEVKLQASAATGGTTVVVLPSGTAGLTLKLDEYADQLGRALAAGKQALENQNGAALEAARGQFGALSANIDFDVKVLGANNVLAPPNGFPPTAAQVAARFPAAADDARFGQTVNAIIANARLIRQRIDTINPAALSQADLDALAAGAANYRNLNQQLASLRPGPVGVTQNGEALNELMRNELPGLFDAISRKSLLVLQAASTQSFSLKTAGGYRDASGLWSFFTNLFAIFTDIKGYAKGNIIELAISLANDLVNIAIANALNLAGEGNLNVEFVAAGGQFSFACPRWQNTYVEGDGFDAHPSYNTTAVIGCINSYALRNLLTLKKAKDLAAAIRLINKIISLVQQAGRDQSLAAVEVPTSTEEGLFGGSRLVFRDGWPRVNQGRLPCVGIVIPINLQTGEFQAVNMNMLPACQ